MWVAIDQWMNEWTPEEQRSCGSLTERTAHSGYQRWPSRVAEAPLSYLWDDNLAVGVCFCERGATLLTERGHFAGVCGYEVRW